MVDTYVAIIMNIYIRQNYYQKSNEKFCLLLVFMSVKKGGNLIETTLYWGESERERQVWQHK